MIIKMVVLSLCLCLLMTACSFAKPETETTIDVQSTVQPTSESTVRLMTGYIRISDDILYIEEVDYITTDDTEKIDEYGLNPSEDMPSGWCVQPLGKELASFNLTENTQFSFIDLEMLFVKESDENRSYSTKDKAEFFKHLNLSDNDIADGDLMYLYHVSITNGNVVSVEEIFGSTI